MSEQAASAQVAKEIYQLLKNAPAESFNLEIAPCRVLVPDFTCRKLSDLRVEVTAYSTGSVRRTRGTDAMNVEAQVFISSPLQEDDFTKADQLCLLTEKIGVFLKNSKYPFTLLPPDDAYPLFDPQFSVDELIEHQLYVGAVQLRFRV